MRKITRLMAFLLMSMPLVFVSCSDDDDNYFQEPVTQSNEEVDEVDEGDIDDNTPQEVSRTVTVEQAGTLRGSVRIMGALVDVTSLTVSGPLNGDDIVFLREMTQCGGSKDNYGNLKKLDLTNATIVEGGSYYLYSNMKFYYTSNNEIGTRMFYNSILEEIKLPISVTSIGQEAFNYCKKLKSVNLPDSLLVIESGAFCLTGLSKVVIPNSVTTIKSDAFWECSSLTDVTLGSSVEVLGSRSFSDNWNLQNVTCYALVPPIKPAAAHPFAFTVGYVMLRNLYVPKGTKDDYLASEIWGAEGYFDIIEME